MTVYVWLLRLLLPLVLLRLLWRGVRNRAYWHRWRERLGWIPSLQHKKVIWLHAVSVGETRASEPLVNALLARYPDHRILITTTTPTGAAQVRRSFGERVAHYYFPFDLPGAVARFLDRARPQLLVVMETEWWPVLFHACRARAIPIIVANLRLSERAAARYRKFPSLTRATLTQVDVFAVQAQADAERLLVLGAPRERVQVTGSIKFDFTLPPDLPQQAQALRNALGARPVWIAASTHEGEETQVLAAHRRLRAKFPGLLLILVPRHPERFVQVARLTRDAGFEIALRSEMPPAAAKVEVLIGDTMGELVLLIAAASVAFVGGSLVPVGGHNILEPAAAGVPAIVGPHMFNFADIHALAVAADYVQTVHNENELATAVARLIDDSALRGQRAAQGLALVAANRGARDKLLALIANRLRTNG